jgi:PIN domain nuclease of toxin-antitoxin system
LSYLLDTHTLIWYLESNPKLSTGVLEILEKKDSICFVSMASLWEIAIKSSLGRMEQAFHPENLEEVLMVFEIPILPIQLPHLQTLMQLPMHHNDPFDRLLLAQAQTENMVFLSRDDRCKKYGIEMVW